MKPITICLTYFRSLTLLNLAAALYSVRQQNFNRIDSIVLVDNNTEDHIQEIEFLVSSFEFPVPCQVVSYKHDDPEKTHAWSTNVVVSHVKTPWIFFTRADYIIAFDAIEKFFEHRSDTPVTSWPSAFSSTYRFVSSYFCHLHCDVSACEQTNWRQDGPSIFRSMPHVEEHYSQIDAGVWLLEKHAFDLAKGLDEKLSAWGHAQTHFQHKLYRAGVSFVRIPEVLFYHPWHGGTRDLALAHKQLAEQGVDLREMWARYDGVKPYG